MILPSIVPQENNGATNRRVVTWRQGNPGATPLSPSGLAKIGSQLVEHAEWLVTQWEYIATEKHPRASAEYRATLRNELPEYLRSLGHQLGDSSRWREDTEVALSHGRQRWRVGWQLDELVRDYKILRKVLLQFLDQGPAGPLQTSEVAVIDEALDDAIAASASAYSEYSEGNWQTLNEALDGKVRERTGQLRKLSLDLVRAEQRERRALAHMLHDGLQQILVAAKIRASVLRPELTAGEHANEMAGILELLDEAIEGARRLSVELSPPMLLRDGLVGALQWLAEWMLEKHLLNVTVVAEPEAAEPESEEVRTFLFHVTRELLFNVVKHSGVPTATVEIWRLDEQFVRLVVWDEGKGFAAPTPESQKTASGLGLPVIQERVSAMGGRMELGRSPSGGARVVVDVPSDPA